MQTRWTPSFSWLDVKLGMRMMRKHPAASLAIILALAIGIPVSLVPNHLVGRTLGQSPPFEEGERVLGLVGVDQGGRADLRIGDYEVLRDRVKSFAALGAVIPTGVNVVSSDGWSEGEAAAFTTATVFTLARMQPIMGRTLVAADEGPGASEVAVIGYRFWRRRLGGTDNVVGTTLRVAGVPTTIVGVMPERFGMPSVEQIWLPLRARSTDDVNGLGPGVRIYGRLRDGVSVGQARAELKTVSLPTAPESRAHPIHADAVAFTAVEIPEPESARAWVLLTIVQTVPVIVLLVACGNAAILMLARTATRWGEMAIRTALGASRVRIVGQLFVEALVLSLVATGLGLVALNLVIARVAERFPAQPDQFGHRVLPFWFDPSLTPAFALKAIGLSILCAVVSGVLPALRATGGRLQPTLQSTGAGGSSLRLGRMAGALVVIEVGFAVVALFLGIMAWNLLQTRPDPNTKVAAADRYLVASIRVPSPESGTPANASMAAPENAAWRVRVANLQEEIGRRLRLQPGVRGWTFSDQPPGEERDEQFLRIDGPADSSGANGAVVTTVDPEFFAVMDISPVAGRLLDAGDVPRDPAVEPTAVVANMKFLERRGTSPQSAIGTRFRFIDPRSREPGPWKEIVGVVPNIEPSADRALADGTPVLMVPASPGTLNPMTVTVDVGASPLSFAPKLRSLVADADPTAFVSQLAALDHLPASISVVGIASGVFTGLSLLACGLSATGLYALMSMTMARRKREFGIRLALGGSTRAVLVTVARRALIQIGLGVTWGAGVWVVLMSTVLNPSSGTEAATMRAPWPYVLAISVVVVVTIALAAALAPTLRYVRMRPVEMLRGDG